MVQPLYPLTQQPTAPKPASTFGQPGVQPSPVRRDVLPVFKATSPLPAATGSIAANNYGLPTQTRSSGSVPMPNLAERMGPSKGPGSAQMPNLAERIGPSTGPGPTPMPNLSRSGNSFGVDGFGRPTTPWGPLPRYVSGSSVARPIAPVNTPSGPAANTPPQYAGNTFNESAEQLDRMYLNQLPTDFRERYLSNRQAGRTSMSPGDAAAYYRSNYAGTDRTLPPMAAASPQPVASSQPAASSSGQIASFDQLPPQLQEAYKQRSASGQTQMTPSQAVEFYNNNYVNGVRSPQSTPGALPAPTAAAMVSPSPALPTPSLDSLPQPTASLRNNQGGYINPLNDPTQRGVDPDEARAYADAEAANAELSAQRGAASARLAEVRRSLGNGAAESEGRAQAVRDAETAARNSRYGYRTGDSGVTRRGVYTPTPSMSDSNPGAFPERESERQVREWSDNTDQRLGGILVDRNARMQSDQDARYAEIMRNMEARRNTRAQDSRVVSSGPRRASI
jgi:hypothetical protein